MLFPNHVPVPEDGYRLFAIPGNKSLYLDFRLPVPYCRVRRFAVPDFFKMPSAWRVPAQPSQLPNEKNRVALSQMTQIPSDFQIASTRALVLPSTNISSGHGRANPSVAHLRVASMPTFEPKSCMRAA